MNSWWLKLYTIPQLKKLGFCYLIAVCSFSFGIMYFPSKALLFAAAYMLPMGSFVSTSINGMISNLDFHKMSVPLRQLRRAFYLDLTIQIVSFLVLGMISLAIPYIAFFPPSAAPIGEFFVSFTPSVLLLLSFSILSFLLALKTKKLKLEVQKQQPKGGLSPKQRKIAVIGCAVLSYVFFSDIPQPTEQVTESLFDKYYSFFNFILIFTGYIFAVNYVFSKTAFHMIRTNNLKQKTSNFFGAFGFAAFFCLMCAFMVKIEINNDLYSSKAKKKTLVFFSDYLPELEVETVRELAKSGAYFSETIFKNADPAIYQMPVEDFVTDKNLFSYLQYMKYGKPSSRNVVYIMNELEKSPEAKKWGDPWAYNQLRQLLVQHHPDAKSLPEHLKRLKLKTKSRDVASKRKPLPDDEGP